MFCAKCGTEMTDDCSFCPKCGTPTSYGKVQKQEENDNKKLNKILVIIALILALILIIQIIIFFSGKSKSADDSTATVPSTELPQEEIAEGTETPTNVGEKIDAAEESKHPEEAQEYNGHYYLVYDNGVSWTTAKAECEAAGGHLVTISNSDEENFVEGLVKMYGKGEYYWIGLSDAASEGTFVWVTGESVSYTNWAENQPDNWNNVEHYVRFPKNDKNYTDWSNPAGKWNDIAENGDENNPLSSFGYICEWEE